MRTKYCMVLFLFMFSIYSAACGKKENKDSKIWFDKPADKMAPTELQSWTIENPNYTSKGNPDKAWLGYVLPIGNGYLGAGIFGSVATERIQLNEKTIWSGGPGVKGYRSADEPDSYYSLDKIRKLSLAGKNKEAENLAKTSLRGNWNKDEYTKFFGSYQTLGELNIETGIDENAVSNYKRELDISTGISTVSFKTDGIEY